jgi:hypothetical protein
MNIEDLAGHIGKVHDGTNISVAVARESREIKQFDQAIHLRASDGI